MNARSQQSGMVLLISLVLLLMLTLIAIAAAHQSSLQTRMAANSQQQNIAFQAAESGISAWVIQLEKSPEKNITLPDIDKYLDTTVRYISSAPAPSNCWDVVPAYSLNAAEGDTSFQYACFNIESRSKACADAACKDIDNPARAEHFQGHLVRY